jgi:carbon-monoxide dehydrogenase large subunit
MSNTYQLRGKSDAASGLAFDLNQPVITVGRHQDNDIVIEHKGISRFHARLIEMDEAYGLEDLNSTNGTFINEKPANGHVLLAPGDVVAFGEHIVLDFLLVPPAPVDDNEATMIGDVGSTPIWQGNQDNAPTTAVPRGDDQATAGAPGLRKDVDESTGVFTSEDVDVPSVDELMAALKKEAPDKAGESQSEADVAQGPAPEKRRILGARLKRVEDPALLAGDSKFTADIELPGMLHMAILRSEHAHALIKNIDTSLAEHRPGVIRVITADDVEGKIMPLPCIWIPGGVESHFPSHPFPGVPGAGSVLAKDRVRYIGDPVAVVVAETRYQAFDALEAIQVEYEQLAVVVDPREALKEGAPQLHEEVPNNLNAYIPYGDKEAASQAIAEADAVVELTTYNQRTMNSPLEPRCGIGDYDAATGEYTLYATTQSPHDHRLLLSLMILGIPLNKLHVVAPEMGGSFGTKGYIYPDMPLVLFLAKELGHPVKWQDTRSGLMRSTVQGRDQHMSGKLAGTKDGQISAIYCTSYANLGAYPSTIGPGVATAMVGRSLSSVYDIANPFCEIYAVFTNIASLGAQRGSGRSEATFFIERLIDLYAMEIGMSPVEVRRKNLIRADQFPFDNRLGWLYDSGDYEAAFDRALEMANYEQLPAMQADAQRRGRRLGMSIAPFVAISGVGPSPRMAKEGMLGGTWESAGIQVHPTGEVSATIGSKPHGQSHETTFGQIVADDLGIDLSQIEILHSDTKRAPFGQGSYGSRSFSVGGAALKLASIEIREKVCKAAAHIMKVPESQIVYADGKAYPRGNPEKAQTLQEIALALWYAWDIPDDMEPSLDVTIFFDPPDFNYPYGVHVALVEVDEQTGEVEIVKYVGVHDAGIAGNELILEGQMQGGIAHGMGQALLEEALYSPDGQLRTPTFWQYPIPRARHIPEIELDLMQTPTPHSVLGAKGAGELGTVGSPAAITNAVCNALADLGVKHIEMPLTPEKVWRAIQKAKEGQSQ